MKRYLILACILLASCGTADESTAPPGPVTPTASAISYEGIGTFTNGHIFCGPGGTTGWYPNQTVNQRRLFPVNYYTWFYWAQDSAVNANLMVLDCNSSTTLYSGGDGGWYSHAPLTCTVHTRRAGVSLWSLDSIVSVQAYNGVYYPASGSNGTWGLIIDWSGGGIGTHDLWNSCGFPNGTAGSLWYTFYSPV